MRQDKVDRLLIARLREASRTFAREQGVLRAERHGASITYSEGHALIELERHGSLGGSALARILNLDKSSTSRMLAKLKRKGWIKQAAGFPDGRSRPFTLTAKGNERLAKLHAEVDRRVEAALAMLSAEERAAVVHGMDLYVKALQAARAEQEKRDRAEE